MRAAVLVVFGLYLLVGTLGREVLSLELPRGFQGWRMFVGTARDTCQVRFSRVRPDGAVEPLEVEPPPRAGQRWRIERKQLPGLERAVCAQARRIEPGTPDVRMLARCGSRRRWVIERDGSTNVCAPRR